MRSRFESMVGLAVAVGGLNLLPFAGALGCSQESSSAGPTGGSGGTGTSSTSSSTTSTAYGGSSGTSSSTTTDTGGSSTTSTGTGGTGGFGPVESCDELSTTDCFSNYDCPDSSTRCQNVGTVELQVACCVPGARGQGALGAPCTGENDCASSLCIELDPQWVCSDQCSGPGQCEEPLPDCVTIPVLEGTFSFCSP